MERGKDETHRPGVAAAHDEVSPTHIPSPLPPTGSWLVRGDDDGAIARAFPNAGGGDPAPCGQKWRVASLIPSLKYLLIIVGGRREGGP